MATIVEKDGRRFLELKKSEVEDQARKLGIIPPVEESLPEIELNQA